MSNPWDDDPIVQSGTSTATASAPWDNDPPAAAATQTQPAVAAPRATATPAVAAPWDNDPPTAPVAPWDNDPPVTGPSDIPGIIAAQTPPGVVPDMRESTPIVPGPPPTMPLQPPLVDGEAEWNIRAKEKIEALRLEGWTPSPTMRLGIIEDERQRAGVPIKPGDTPQQIAATPMTGGIGGAAQDWIEQKKTAIRGGVFNTPMSAVGLVAPDYAKEKMEQFAAREGVPDTTGNTIAGGLGSAIPTALIGAAGAAAAPAVGLGAVAGGMIAAGSAGLAAGAGGGRVEVARAREQGQQISGGQEAAYAASGALAEGIPEALSFGVAKAVGVKQATSAVVKSLGKRLLAAAGINIPTNMAEEATTEFLQNVAARATGVDPNRPLTQGMKEAAIGGIGGGVVSTGISATEQPQTAIRTADGIEAVPQPGNVNDARQRLAQAVAPVAQERGQQVREFANREAVIADEAKLDQQETQTVQPVRQGATLQPVAEAQGAGRTPPPEQAPQRPGGNKDIEAKHPSVKFARRTDGTLKTKGEYTSEEWAEYTRSVIDQKLKQPPPPAAPEPPRANSSNAVEPEAPPSVDTARPAPVDPGQAGAKKSWEMGAAEFRESKLSPGVAARDASGNVYRARPGEHHGDLRTRLAEGTIEENGGINIGPANVDRDGFTLGGEFFSVRDLDPYQGNVHKALLARRIAKGQPVPPEVLAEYPDLSATRASAVESQTAAPDFIPGAEAPAPAAPTRVKQGPGWDRERVQLQAWLSEGKRLTELLSLDKPLPKNMAGETRQPPKPKTAPSAFEKLHPESQRRFNEAWGARDPAKMRELTDPMNKGLRAEFEKRSGVKLPQGLSATQEAVAKYFAPDPDAPVLSDDEKAELLKPMEEEGGGGGGSGAALTASATGTTTFMQTPAAKAGSVTTKTLNPMAVPEMVALAKEFMGGKYPRVLKSMKALGYFKGDSKTGHLKIRADQGADPKQLAGVLAHEIGHAVDWSPDATLKRGNILGRVATLHSYLKGTLAGTPPLSRSEIHKELISVSEWWRGPIVGNNAHAKYRKSSKEVYADAISVLLNSPGDLQQRAPKFFRAFFDNADKKPEVRDACFKLMDLLNGTPEDVATARRQDIREMFSKGEDIWKARHKEIEDGKQSWGSYLRQLLFDKSIPVLAIERKAVGKSTLPWDQSMAAKHALEELNMSGNALHLWAKDVHDTVTKPMEAAGIDREAMGEMLFLDRVAEGDRGGAGERAQEIIKQMTGKATWPEAKAEFEPMAATDPSAAELLEQAMSGKINPLGHTPQTAREQLADLQKEFGPAKWKQAMELKQKFHDLQWKVVQEAKAVGTYNAKMVDELIAPNKDHYAPFAVLEYLDTKVKAGIFKQIGTFKEIANPMDSALLKTMSLIRLNELQKAKREVVPLLRKMGEAGEPQEIDKFHRLKPAKEGRDHIILLEDGKPVAYEVDDYVAKVFQSHDIGALTRVSKWLNSSYRIFHPLWIGYNVGWQAMNIPRDVKRTYVNTAALRADQGKMRQVLGAILDLPRVGLHYIKAMPPSFRRGFGWDDALITKMMKERAIGTPFVKRQIGDDTVEYDRFLQDTGVWKKERSRNLIVRTLGRIADGVENIGVMTETLPKVASYSMAGKAGKSGVERAYIVRNYAGTPNTRRRGLTVDLHNALYTYSNVILQGYRADAEIAFNPKTAGGRWLRAAMLDYLPKAAMAAAAGGVFGAVMKQLMDDIPEYEKAKYIIIPLGRESQTGKPVYLRLPHNDTDRVLAAAAWKLQQQEGAEKLSNAFGVVSGEFPGLNPYIQMASKWGQYLAGHNPRDEFRGREIIGRDEQKVGGIPRLKPMLQWTSDQFGVAGGAIRVFTDWNKDTATGREKGTTEKIIGNVPGMSRMVRVSDRGKSEKAWESVDADDREDAELRLSLPGSARLITQERSRLNRLGVDRLDAAQRQRRTKVNDWYTKTYTPKREGIKAAEAKGDKATADRLRKELQSSSALVK